MDSRSLLCSALLLVAHPVLAVDLSVQPQLKIGTRATDNLRSAARDEEAAWGFDTGGGAALDIAAANWKSEITPNFNFRRFAIGENADSEEYGVTTATQWAVTSDLQTSLNGSYLRDSTLSTEATDAGLRTDIVERQTVSIQPGVYYLVDPDTSINASIAYSNVKFAKRENTGFVNYDYRQANLGATHAYSDVFSVTSRVFYSEFRTPGTNGESRTYGGEVGVLYKYSSTLDADLNVGYLQSDTDFEETRVTGFKVIGTDPLTGQPVVSPVFALFQNSDTSNGPIARATIRKAFQEWRTQLSYERGVSPSSRGAQTISDDIVLTLEHRFTSRLTFGFRGGYNMRGAEIASSRNGVNILDRDQVMVMPSLRYRFTEEMSVAAVYRFIWNQQSQPDLATYNNSLFVTFNYNGQPHFFRGY